MGELREALAAGDELLPTTHLPVDLAALVSAGLTGDLQEELSSGTSPAWEGCWGKPRRLSTWAFSGGVNTATMAALAGMGARQVAVPEGDLSALPPAAVNLTFSLPTELAVQGKTLRVMGADSELSARTAQASVPGQTALVANQVLAELAMVDLEAPGHLRGIVVAPPPGAVLSPRLPVCRPGRAARQPPAGRRNPGPDVPRPLGGHSGERAPLGTPTGGPRRRRPWAGPSCWRRRGPRCRPTAELYGASSPLVGSLDQELEVSLSAAFSASQRAAMIGAALRGAESDLSKVRLPPSSSITLTSRQGRLPLTLLSSAGTPVRVLLTLTSEQLSFVDAKFGSVGSCRPVSPGSEDCQLTLSRSTTALQVPGGGAHQRRLPLGAAAGHALGFRGDRVGHRHRPLDGHLRRRPGPHGERRAFPGRLVGPQRPARPPGTPAGPTSRRRRGH